MLEDLYQERDIYTVVFSWSGDEAPVTPPNEAELASHIRSKCRYSTDVRITHTDTDCRRTFNISADIGMAVSIHEILCYLIYPMYSQSYWVSITVQSHTTDGTLQITL